MIPQDFGTNRLKSGFHNRRPHHDPQHPRATSDSDKAFPMNGNDLETEDDDEAEGGITLNLQGTGHSGSPILISDDDEARDSGAIAFEDSDLEEGEEREDMSTEENTQIPDGQSEPSRQTPDVSFVIDPTPSTQQKLLKDLTSAQLEHQIRYAFWQLPRDQIDLSRPARCLHCQVEGHIDETCPAKMCSHCGAFAEHESDLCPSARRCQRCRQLGHSDCRGMRNTTVPCDICTLKGHTEDGCPVKHYNRQVIPTTEKLQLWISCCACASKSHLVGDCPEVSPVKAPRWSLRSIDPNKVSNLSLQTGIEKRERQAENKGMRPEGIKIRGRANRYLNTAPDLSESDDMDDFLSYPPRREMNRGPPPRMQFPRSDQYRPGGDNRYDRYNGPSETYRPPRNAYYATDSFGRQRSRSPARYGQRSNIHSRSQSPSSFSSHRMSDDLVSDRRPPPKPKSRSIEQRIQHDLPQKPPSRGNVFQVPIRKGSNPNLAAGSSSNQSSHQSGPVDTGSVQTTNRQNSKDTMGQYQKKHNGLTRAQHKNLKAKKKGKN